MDSEIIVQSIMHEQKDFYSPRVLEDPSEQFSESEILGYFVAEVVVKAVPAFLFLILATIRFFEIRPIGFSKTTSYSKLFLAKLTLQYVQALFQIIMLVLCFIPSLFSDIINAVNDYFMLPTDNSILLDQYFDIALKLHLKLSFMFWKYAHSSQSSTLRQPSYTLPEDLFRGLWQNSQECCAIIQKQNFITNDFRYLNLLAILNISAWLVAGKLLAYEYRKRLSETYYTHWLFWILTFMTQLCFMIINFSVYQTLMIVMSIIQCSITLIICILMMLTKRRTADNLRPDEPLLEDYAFKGEKVKDIKRSFSSSQHANEYLVIKMSRKFIQDQSLSNKYEFTVYMTKLQDQYKVTKTYLEFIQLEQHILEIINHYDSQKKHNSKFPFLSKTFNTTKQLLPSAKGTHQRQISNADKNTDKVFIKRIEGLEKFLKNIIATQEFWNEYVFDFLQVPQNYQVQLLEAKNKSMNKQKVFKGKSNRQKSYIERKSTSAEISSEKEESKFESQEGSAEVNQFILIDDYMQPSGKEKPSGHMSRSSFSVRFLNWHKIEDNSDEHYQFSIQIEYLEGEGGKWNIFRRYSDFHELHTSLAYYFSIQRQINPKFEEPQLPAKIFKEDIVSIEQRKVQLEQYLRQVVINDSIPGAVLNFIEFNQHSQFKVRATIVDEMNSINQVYVKINSSDILIDQQQKPRVYFKIELHLKSEHSWNVHMLQKVYRDFHHFHQQLEGTFINNPQLYSQIPALPSKTDQSGAKLQAEDLQKKLEDYINTILSNQNLKTLLCVKTFLSPDLDLINGRINDSFVSPQESPVNHNNLTGSLLNVSNLVKNSSITHSYPLHEISAFKFTKMERRDNDQSEEEEEEEYDNDPFNLANR